MRAVDQPVRLPGNAAGFVPMEDIAALDDLTAEARELGMGY
jgi:hypothetical protein